MPKSLLSASRMYPVVLRHARRNNVQPAAALLMVETLCLPRDSNSVRTEAIDSKTRQLRRRIAALLAGVGGSQIDKSMREGIIKSGVVKLIGQKRDGMLSGNSVRRSGNGGSNEGECEEFV